jgi:hypothetical protein
MVTTHRRPSTTTKAKRQKRTDTENDSYGHSSRGFAHWLEVAPPTATFEEVAAAFKQYDDPHNAWPKNHALTDFDGGENDA